VQKGDDDDNTC